MIIYSRSLLVWSLSLNCLPMLGLKHEFYPCLGGWNTFSQCYHPVLAELPTQTHRHSQTHHMSTC